MCNVQYIIIPSSIALKDSSIQLVGKAVGYVFSVETHSLCLLLLFTHFPVLCVIMVLPIAE